MPASLELLDRQVLSVSSRSDRAVLNATHRSTPGNRGFTRLTIRDGSHTLPLHVANGTEYERGQAPGSRDFQPLAAHRYDHRALS